MSLASSTPGGIILLPFSRVCRRRILLSTQLILLSQQQDWEMGLSSEFVNSSKDYLRPLLVNLKFGFLRKTQRILLLAP